MNFHKSADLFHKSDSTLRFQKTTHAPKLPSRIDLATKQCKLLSMMPKVEDAVAELAEMAELPPLAAAEALDKAAVAPLPSPSPPAAPAAAAPSLLSAAPAAAAPPPVEEPLAAAEDPAEDPEDEPLAVAVVNPLLQSRLLVSFYQVRFASSDSFLSRLPLVSKIKKVKDEKSKPVISVINLHVSTTTTKKYYKDVIKMAIYLIQGPIIHQQKPWCYLRASVRRRIRRHKRQCS